MMFSHVKKIIAPSGTVHPKYFQFVGYSFVSNVFLGAQGVLSTHSMLSVISHSSTEAMMSANYIGKDIIGQLGSLCYMSKMATYADTKTEKFIKHSIILQQSALLMEACLPLFPWGNFVVLAGASNIAKGLSFTGFGAINAKSIATLSSDDGRQIGEIYSKLTLVNTLASTIGMGLGLGIIAAVPDHHTRVLFTPILALGRVWSFNRSIENIME